jgi:hypothetical protein
MACNKRVTVLSGLTRGHKKSKLRVALCLTLCNRIFTHTWQIKTSESQWSLRLWSTMFPLKISHLSRHLLKKSLRHCSTLAFKVGKTAAWLFWTKTKLSTVYQQIQHRIIFWEKNCFHFWMHKSWKQKLYSTPMKHSWSAAFRTWPKSRSLRSRSRLKASTLSTTLVISSWHRSGSQW